MHLKGSENITEVCRELPPRFDFYTVWNRHQGLNKRASSEFCLDVLRSEYQSVLRADHHARICLYCLNECGYLYDSPLNPRQFR